MVHVKLHTVVVADKTDESQMDRFKSVSPGRRATVAAVASDPSITKRACRWPSSSVSPQAIFYTAGDCSKKSTFLKV